MPLHTQRRENASLAKPAQHPATRPNADLVNVSRPPLFLPRRRPTRETHWWDDHPHILAGRDGEAGGTWLGITSEGRVAVLTNFTEAIADRQSHAPSRGKLPVDFLKASLAQARLLSLI